MSCCIFFATALICLLQAFNSPGFRRSSLYFAVAMTLSGLAVVLLAITPTTDWKALFKVSSGMASSGFLLVLLAVLRVARPNAPLTLFFCFCGFAAASHVLSTETNTLRHWNWLIQVICTISMVIAIFWSREPIGRQLRWLSMLFGLVFLTAFFPHLWCFFANWWSAGANFDSFEQAAENDSVLFPLRVLVWTLVPFVFYAITNAIVSSLITHRMKGLLNTDQLTGAQSRRAMFEKGEVWFAKKTASIYALLIDLDHFKQINDTHGHLIGDRALTACAGRIREVVRQTDCIVSRYGGEEFCVLLKDTSAGEAERIANRICEHISAQPFVFDSIKLSMTVSIGVAGSSSTDTLTGLLGRADQLLYQAKKLGRNCVSVRPLPLLESGV